MALTEINSKGIKDGEIVNADIADDTITEAKLDVSNNPTNGQFLQAQSGEGGGLTWASVANVPTTITVADESSDASCNVLFVTDATGDLAPKTGTNLTFDSSGAGVLSTGAVTATTFNGDLTGTAVNATHVNVADNENTDENNLITFIENASATGDVGLESDGDFHYNPSTGKVTATVFTDTKGDVRAIPKVAKTSSYTLVASDAGKCISTDSGVTIPNAVFAAGDAVTIFNDSSSAITITQGSGFQLRKAGETSTGNVTLTNFGLATLWWNTGGTAVITGNLG